jgi:GAF domain-containing protein
MGATGVTSASRELERLRLLDEMNIWQSAREDDFDRIVFTAAQIFRAPVAMFNLIDASYLWAKAKVGPINGLMLRHHALCSDTITNNAVTIIPDARHDPRLAANPAVIGEPFIRFYVGAPLIGRDNLALGALCVLDRRPRMPTREQEQALITLAETGVRLMEERAARLRPAPRIDRPRADETRVRVSAGPVGSGRLHGGKGDAG